MVFPAFRRGDLAGIRTPDPLLKRQLLCLLSYQVLWQGRRDSNPRYQSQSLVCYLYTTSLWMPPSCMKGNRLTGWTGQPIEMGWEMGLEPTTPGTTIRYSNQLSYTHHIIKMARQKGLEPLAYCLEGSCSIHLSYWRIYPAFSLERAMGIEPTSPAWKAGALAVVLHPRVPADLHTAQVEGSSVSSRPTDGTTYFLLCQMFFAIFKKFSPAYQNTGLFLPTDSRDPPPGRSLLPYMRVYRDGWARAVISSRRSGRRRRPGRGRCRRGR